MGKEFVVKHIRLKHAARMETELAKVLPLLVRSTWHQRASAPSHASHGGTAPIMAALAHSVRHMTR